MKKICEWCEYAEMRDDICGIYCTGGLTNEDGSCEYFQYHADAEEGVNESDGRDDS